MSDSVLLSTRDLGDGLGGLSSLSAHVGTLGETAELCGMLVDVDLGGVLMWQKNLQSRRSYQ